MLDFLKVYALFGLMAVTSTIDSDMKTATRFVSGIFWPVTVFVAIEVAGKEFKERQK